MQGLFKIFKKETFKPGQKIIIFALCGLFFYSGMSLMEAIFPLWANRLFSYGPSHIGSVFFMLGLISVVIQGGLIGPLTKWLGEIRLIQTAAIFMMIGLSLIGSAISILVLWVGLFFYGCGAAMFNPSLSSLVSKRANPNEKGLFLGQYQSACALGRILGPLFSGVLFSQVSTSAPLYVGAVLGIPVIVLITNFALRRKNEGIE